MATPLKQRHPKQNPAVRCCWVCGRTGGDGFTSALRGFGYDIPPNGVVAHAHPACIAKLQRQRRRTEFRAGKCDVCNERTGRRLVKVHGIDTWICDPCQGGDA